MEAIVTSTMSVVYISFRGPSFPWLIKVRKMISAGPGAFLYRERSD